MSLEDPFESMNNDVLGYDIYQEGSPANLKPKEQPKPQKNEKPKKIIDNAKESAKENYNKTKNMFISNIAKYPIVEIVVGGLLGSVIAEHIDTGSSYVNDTRKKQIGALAGIAIGLGAFIYRK